MSGNNILFAPFKLGFFSNKHILWNQINTSDSKFLAVMFSFSDINLYRPHNIAQKFLFQYKKSSLSYGSDFELKNKGLKTQNSSGQWAYSRNGFGTPKLCIKKCLPSLHVDLK